MRIAPLPSVCPLIVVAACYRSFIFGDATTESLIIDNRIVATSFIVLLPVVRGAATIGLLIDV